MGDGLSVVIATRDRPHLLARCLETVERALRPGDDLIVADSSSCQDEVAAIVDRHGGRLVRCPRPGTSFQRNLGAAEASHQIVAFLDDDVRVAPTWAAAIEEAFTSDPDAAFVTGRLEVAAEQAGYARPVSIKTEADPAALTPLMRGTLGHSANMAVRRSAFQRIGGFEERLGPGTRFPAAEDGDLFDRFFAAGYQGRYDPAALGWHDQWRSRRELVKLEWRYGIGTGARLARLARADRGRAKLVVGDYLWANGLKLLPSMVRERYEFGIVFVLARLTGASVGFVEATAARLGDAR